MIAFVRLVLLLAALSLGMTPATAHGGHGGPGEASHCAPAAAAAAADHGADRPSAHPGHGPSDHLTPLCLCALVTTLTVLPQAQPPGYVHAAPARPQARPLAGRAPPPADRPPRA